MTAPSTGSTRGHVPALDGVRGVAILLVLLLHLYHFEGRNVAEHVVVSLVSVGWVGVELFFVLSGFLITGILLDTTARPGYLRDFYARRALRILPLHYATLVALYLVVPWVSPSESAGYRDYAASSPWLWLVGLNIAKSFAVWAAAVPSIVAVLWSLGIEEQFYLVWPWVVRGVGRPRLRTLCLALLPAAFLCRLVLRSFESMAAAGVAQPFTYEAAYCLPLAHCDGLAFGAWLALAAREPSLWARLSRVVAPLATLSPPRLAMAALGGTGFVLVVGPSPYALAMQTVGYPAIAVGFGALLVASLTAPAGAPLARLMRAPALRALGKYSYALYLFHPIVARAVHHWGFRPDGGATHGVAEFAGELAYVAVAGGATYALAWASWRWLESPMLSLGRHLGTRAWPPTPEATTVSRGAVLGAQEASERRGP